MPGATNYDSLYQSPLTSPARRGVATPAVAEDDDDELSEFPSAGEMIPVPHDHFPHDHLPEPASPPRRNINTGPAANTATGTIDAAALPEALSGTLDFIVGQLDFITQNLSILEQRLSGMEKVVQRLDAKDRERDGF